LQLPKFGFSRYRPVTVVLKLPIYRFTAVGDFTVANTGLLKCFGLLLAFFDLILKKKLGFWKD
jgi:hypothetical protein